LATGGRRRRLPITDAEKIANLVKPGRVSKPNGDIRGLNDIEIYMLTSSGIHISDHDLRQFVAQIFAAKGMRFEDAVIVADVLCFANRRGIASHGVSRIASYLGFIDKGDLDPRAEPVLRAISPSLFVLAGRRAAGPIAMTMAVDEAIVQARTSGVCIGLVSETTHTGAVGYYSGRAAAADCAAIIVGAGPPNMAYHGARVASLSTSPITIAVPGGSGPLMLDMATSIAAMGRLNEARDTGEKLPEGWAFDADGELTTDPAAAKITLPLGGPKGSGLALLIECVTGVLAGTPILSQMLGPAAARRHMQNALILVIDIASIRPVREFRADIDHLSALIKALPRRLDNGEILLPGERGARVAAQSAMRGIALSRKAWRRLCEIGLTLGVEPPPIQEG
jgi:ureidoglycolate dehydrogenase (NAD+)